MHWKRDGRKEESADAVAAGLTRSARTHDGSDGSRLDVCGLGLQYGEESSGAGTVRLSLNVHRFHLGAPALAVEKHAA